MIDYSVGHRRAGRHRESPWAGPDLHRV